jgi:hypothetical protein
MNRQLFFILLAMFLVNNYCNGQEICNNGIDDDNDGLVDCSDCTDCANFGNCLDTDNDGISDICDLDDDNDGILDYNESCSSVPVDFSSMVQTNSSGNSQTFTTDINGNSLAANLIVSPPYITGGSPANFYVRGNLGNVAESFRFTNNSGYKNGESFAVDFTLSSPQRVYISADNDVSASLITIADEFIFTPIGSVSSTFQWDILVSDFITVSRFGNSLRVTGLGATSNSPFAEFIIVPNEAINGFKVDYLTKQNGNSSNNGVFNFSFCSADGDNDGIINSLDSDSDNDGCPDAIEGGGAFTNTNIDVNLRLTGGIDADGIPIIATADGQNIGSSLDATVNICPEVCDDGQDNDGDGLIDCADSDCQPVITDVAVIQPTCTNKTSGQIVITASSQSILQYSITNEPSWQNSNIFYNIGVGQYTIRVQSDAGCEVEYSNNPIIFDFETCIEICNDGIDNDGDGLVDCDDTDCISTGIITQINNN